MKYFVATVLRGWGGGEILCLYFLGGGGAAATLNPLPKTRPCSADFATIY